MKMAKKKQLDKLSLDMIQCAKDGFGVQYGKWKATQPVVKVDKEIPDGFCVCEYCGQWYKPSTKRLQKYCGAYCQIAAQKQRDKEKHAKYIRDYRERKATNESNA